jgi:putative intracellular protease/amidase
MEEDMKRLLVLLALSTIIVSCSKSNPAVLLFMRDGSPELEFMLKNEVSVMKDALERSGIRVVVATQDGSSFSAGPVSVKADLKLADVQVADYAGFILPCMASGNFFDNPMISEESVALVKKAISAGKPVAAQTGSVWALAEAGALKGKKYAEAAELKAPPFAETIYSGTGIVRDGLVITSGICPYMARQLKTSDGTERLALALVDAIKGK